MWHQPELGKALDDIVHGERHATCLLKAQKEVLICIGKLVLKRLHDAKQVRVKKA